MFPQDIPAAPSDTKKKGGKSKGKKRKDVARNWYNMLPEPIAKARKTKNQEDKLRIARANNATESRAAKQDSAQASTLVKAVHKNTANQASNGKFESPEKHGISTPMNSQTQPSQTSGAIINMKSRNYIPPGFHGTVDETLERYAFKALSR